MIFEQTFSFTDIPRVAILAFLEVLLSADNAIILGLIASRLDPSFRKRALLIGFVSAWVFRLGAILGIAYLLQFQWIQAAGGLYLLYLSIHHFIKKTKKRPRIVAVPNFWKTVVLIELFDLAFAVDSIVAGVAFIGTSPEIGRIHPKLWIVYLGGMIGVFTIRYAANFFGGLLQRFPRLETSAYVMIAWIGLKLGCSAFFWTFPYFEIVFWGVLILLFTLGFRKGVSRRV